MLFRVPFLFFVALLPLVSTPRYSFAEDDIAEAIRLKLETANLYNELYLAEEPVYCIKTLREFYSKRKFQPAWWQSTNF